MPLEMSYWKFISNIYWQRWEFECGNNKKMRENLAAINSSRELFIAPFFVSNALQQIQLLWNASIQLKANYWILIRVPPTYIISHSSCTREHLSVVCGEKITFCCRNNFSIVGGQCTFSIFYLIRFKFIFAFSTQNLFHFKIYSAVIILEIIN